MRKIISHEKCTPPLVLNPSLPLFTTLCQDRVTEMYKKNHYSVVILSVVLLIMSLL